MLDLAALLYTSVGHENASVENELTVIQKIKMRQLYNGTLLLWVNESTDSWWTTAYAAHFLWEAKKAAFQIENNLIQPLLNYFSNRLQQKVFINYTYTQNLHKKNSTQRRGLLFICIGTCSKVQCINYELL